MVEIKMNKIFDVTAEFKVKAKDLSDAINTVTSYIETDEYYSITDCKESIFHYGKPTEKEVKYRFEMCKVNDENIHYDLWYVKDYLDKNNPLSTIIGSYAFIHQIYEWVVSNYPTE